MANRGRYLGLLSVPSQAWLVIQLHICARASLLLDRTLISAQQGTNGSSPFFFPFGPRPGRSHVAAGALPPEPRRPLPRRCPCALCPTAPNRASAAAIRQIFTRHRHDATADDLQLLCSSTDADPVGVCVFVVEELDEHSSSRVLLSLLA